MERSTTSSIFGLRGRATKIGGTCTASPPCISQAIIASQLPISRGTFTKRRCPGGAFGAHRAPGSRAENLRSACLHRTHAGSPRRRALRYARAQQRTVLLPGASDRANDCALPPGTTPAQAVLVPSMALFDQAERYAFVLF